MEQLILFINSLLAILLLALLAKLYWPQKWILDEGRVLRAFERSDYDVHVSKVWVDSTQSAALARLNNTDTIGYAFAFGDRVTCRVLKSVDLKSISGADNHIDISFTDHTLNSRRFNFADDDNYQAVLKLLTDIAPDGEVLP